MLGLMLVAAEVVAIFLAAQPPETVTQRARRYGIITQQGAKIGRYLQPKRITRRITCSSLSQTLITGNSSLAARHITSHHITTPPYHTIAHANCNTRVAAQNPVAYHLCIDYSSTDSLTLCARPLTALAIHPPNPPTIVTVLCSRRDDEAATDLGRQRGQLRHSSGPGARGDTDHVNTEPLR